MPHRLVVHPGCQQRKPTPVHLGKGAGKRRRDRPHEVVHGPRTLTPIDAAILGTPPAKIRTLGKIQRDGGRRAGQERRQAAMQYRLRRGGHFERYVERGVVLQDGHGLLVHQRAGIGFCEHVMQAGPGGRFALKDGPMHRCPATIPRTPSTACWDRQAFPREGHGPHPVFRRCRTIAARPGRPHA